MAEPKSTPVGRLAMCHEGEFWNAYYAATDSMDGAVLLGSIRGGAVTSRFPERKEAFTRMMASIVSDLLTDIVGVRPSWDDPEADPEHKRSGHG